MMIKVAVVEWTVVLAKKKLTLMLLLSTAGALQSFIHWHDLIPSSMFSDQASHEVQAGMPHE